MDFNHSANLEDTIVAIATPPGEGAISAIRLSGEKALEIADSVFSGSVLSYDSHTAHYGKILAEDDSIIDRVLLLVMINPKSYTGENSVEIFCHGGKLITQRVYERLLEKGARAAIPGEFTFRAFQNGKIDLAQAEAVQSFIGAQNEQALKIAEQQLEGRLSNEIRLLQKELVHILGILEAWVDFPEEDLEFSKLSEIIVQLEKLKAQMQELVSTYDYGQLLEEGFSLCLVGPPNAGKSSLMNALLGKERAIVTHLPGTTRDLIEESIYLGKVHFRLIDTAGIRKTKKVIEQIGIQKSLKAQENADVILLVLDAHKSVDLTNFNHLNWDKTLLVWNKIDLGKHPSEITAPHQVEVSALKKQNLQEIHKKIEEILFEKTHFDAQKPVLTKSRHKLAILRAVSACERAITGLNENISQEFICADLRDALNELGSVIGMNVTEEVLTEIFATFCLGK